MEEARAIARAGRRDGRRAASTSKVLDVRAAAPASRRASSATRRPSGRPSSRALERDNGRLLAKLEESPVLPRGRRPGVRLGRGRDGRRAARVVADVFRLGDDQAVELELDRGRAGRGPARARGAWTARAGSRRCATTRPRTCCTRRCARGSARTSARPARTSARTSCASTSPTASGSRSEELADVEEAVNAWIVENHPVRAVHTTRDEAERLGAMALFGEKYGDWVRMVDVDGVSRELCGGTHVGSTAEVGLFHVTQETSSASNVRRIEALTAAGGIEVFRRRTRGDARARGDAARARARGRRRRAQAAAALKEAKKRPKRATAAMRAQAERSPGARRRSAACAWSPRSSRWTTRRRCSRCPTSCGRSSATARSCSARRSTAASHLVANFAPVGGRARARTPATCQASPPDRRRRRRRPADARAGGRQGPGEAPGGARGGARSRSRSSSA